MAKKINPLLVIVSLSFILRILYLYLFAQDLFFNTFSDAATYNLWAEKIIAGQGPHPPFFMSPLYPYLIALVYLIFGKSITLILLLQVFLDTATTYIIYRMSKIIFNERVALVSSFLYAVFPSAIFYSGLLLMPTALTFLLTLATYLIISALKRDKEALFFLSGLLFGIACLGRGNILLPAIVPLFYTFKKRYLIGVLIPILILTTINITVGKSPVLLTYNFGLNLYIGNSPIANGEYQRPPGLDLANDHDGRKIISHLLHKKIPRWQTSGYWTGLALKYMKENPLNSIILMVKKLYLFWGPVEVAQFENIYYVFQRTLLRYLPLRIWLIVPLFLISIFFNRRRYTKLLLTITLLYSFSFLPFFIIGRFCQPVTPAVIILASGFFFYLIKKIRKKAPMIPGLTATTIGIYIILFLANQPKIASELLETRSDYTLWLAYNNRVPEAYDSTRAILKDHPLHVQTLVNLGNFFYRAKNYPVARVLYEKARSTEPDNGEANANLGVTLIALGKPDSAIPVLEKAKTLMPFSLAIDSSIVTARSILKKDR